MTRCEGVPSMPRLVILGNSGSGKSTLALRLARARSLAHLDLDTRAWEPWIPPTRRPLTESARDIAVFMDANGDWVIEGCYADLLAIPVQRCTRMIFLNPGRLHRQCKRASVGAAQVSEQGGTGRQSRDAHGLDPRLRAPHR